MADIKNIILNTSAEALEDMIAPFIEEQFPTFIRTDYRKLVLFIKAYYEWMDSQGQPGYVLGKLDTVSDVDRNVEEFFSHFKNTYLLSFPELLATDSLGNKPNKKTLLKKIRDFYGNKGTENSYKFLFRVLYDSDLEIYYPKTDILKPSDGQWIEPVSVKTTSVNAANLFSVKNGTIAQYDSAANLIASATIDSVVQYSFNGLPITEFFIKDINGDFLPNRETVLSKDSVSYTETSYSVLGEFFVELQGEGYQVGDIVSVVAANGVGFIARIEQTGLAGSVKKIGIINSGINYEADVIATIVSNTGNAQAKVIVKRSAVTRYPGYFSGNRGKVSSNKFVQDGNYYQEFSYELKSAVSLDTYFDVLKRIVHPAGMRMFGSVLVKQAIDNTVSSSSQQTTFEVPVIGRYTPYALRTFNDLRGGYFLPNQVKGATLQVWLSGYNIAGNTSSGITAGWGVLPDAFSIGSDPSGRSVDREDIFGVQHWRSAVGGHTFSHPSLYPNSNVWLTPNFQRESLNTHPTIRTRPVQYNFSGPAYGSALVSLGFSGPTMGALGITRDRSFFTVVKPGRVSTATTWDGSAQAYVLSNSVERHGVWFGVTGGTVCVATFNRSASSVYSGVTAPIGGTGSWKLVSTAYSIGAGSSGPLSLFVNGVCYGTASSSAVDLAQLNVSNTLIGMRASSSFAGAFDGEIAEILAYQGALSDGDRQKVEGYLAHKYNLDGNLPQGHPYKTTPPGASLPAGGWSGATGDFYPRGYNPYIGSTTETGPDGSTAAAGSLFFGSGMGYTYTVVDEFGLTAHNPVGAPLGSTYAWFNSKENSPSPEGMRGLVLWLKPENIGVCGSVANGASADVWTDASPSANHALPPTWDRWNGIAHITQTAASGYFTESVRSTNPVTKLAFVANGLCGGFTHGRLFMMGLATNPAASNYYDNIDYAVYSYGSSGTAYTISRQYLVYESGNSRGAITTGANATSNYFAYDNTVCEVEYTEPNIVYRVDGVVKRTVFAGYGRTFYFDSSFYGAASSSDPKTSVTLLDLSYNGNPVVPNFVSTANMNARVYAGVTVDKLRPTLQTAGFGGATGVSFNGGIVFAPASVYAGVTLGGVVGLGYTTGTGSSAAAMLTGQHLYLKRPLKITDDADIFVVYRTTREGLSFGYGLLGSRNTNCDLSATPSVRFDSVLFSRSYNEQDRTAAQQTSSYYSVLPNGTLMYPGASLPPTGVFGFRPCGDQTGVLQNSIVYDPHVSGVCFGVCVGEAVRDSSNKIDVFLNGDRGLNASRSTGRRVVSVVAPSAENWVTTRNLVYGFDAGNTLCIGSFASGFSSDLLRDLHFTPTPYNVLKSGFDPNNFRSDPNSQGVGFTRVTQATGEPTLGNDEVYKAVISTNGNLYTDPSYGTNSWRNTTFSVTHWTFSMWIRKADGSALPSALGVYIYGLGTNDSAPATIEDMGSGWYRVSRKKYVSDSVSTTVTTVGVTGLTPGETVYFGRLQLLPYNGGDIDGRAFRTGVNYPSWAAVAGSIQANSIEKEVNPWGYYDNIWRGENHSTIATSASFNSNAGFNTQLFSVDTSKKYRYSVWINRKVLGDGDVYFGPSNGSYLSRKSGFSQTNPYFTVKNSVSDAYTGKQNTWVLAVGHIHPFGSATGADESTSGYYTVSGGGSTYAPISTGNDDNYHDFIWSQSGIVPTGLRVFLYGSSIPGSEVLFYRPRIDVVDGNEPDVTDLVSNMPQTVYDTGPNGFTGKVFGKPQYISSVGGYLVFDGKSSVIESGATSLTGNSYTFEAWVKPSDVSSALKMFGGMGGLPYFGTLGNAYYWSFSLSGVQKAYAYTVPYTIDTRWAQFVYTANHIPATAGSTQKTQFKVYINGVSVWEQTLDGVEIFGSVVGIGDRSGANTTTEGSYVYTNGNDYKWSGGISNVRVYSRALVSQEIAQNYNSLRGRFGM